MYKSFMQIIQLKKTDIVWQLTGSIFMVACLFYTSAGLFALYIMAAVQLISVLYWSVILYNLPVKNSRRNLQRVFLITAPLLLLSYWLFPSFFYSVSICLMLWIGPLFGISYFITTVAEIRFYRGLVHRDAV